MSVRPLVLLALWSVPAVAAAPESVTFTFGWKPGMKATVHDVATKTHDGERKNDFDAETRLTVKPHDEGRLELVQCAAPGSAPAFEGMPEPLRDALKELGDAGPSTLVAADGTWVGTTDPEAYRAFVDRVLADLDADLESIEDAKGAEAAQGFRAMVAQGLSPEVLQAKEAELWGDLVGFWLGATLEVGATYAFDDQTTNALGDPMKLATTFVVEARVPCHDGRKAPSCVRVRRRAEADPEALRATMAAWLRQHLGSLGLPLDALQSVSSVTELVLVTEPDTLRPWRMERTRTNTQVMDAGDGAGPRTSVDVDARTITWTWR